MRRSILYAVIALQLIAGAAFGQATKTAELKTIRLPLHMVLHGLGTCPKCKHENDPTARFCTDCGTVLKVGGCLHCGADNASGSKFCNKCGFDLSKTTDENAKVITAPSTPAEIGQSAEPETMGPKTKMLWFASANAQAGTRKGQTSSFGLGELDLFVTSRLSDKLTILTENVIAPGPDNGTGLDTERLLLSYALTDNFTASMGRYHTHVGYYSTAYHHGNFLQTAATRPFLFRFEDEDGPLPIHSVGVALEGRVPNNKLGLRYFLELGNGRTGTSTTNNAVQNGGDENNGKSINFAVIARPDSTPGLQLGLSLYHDKFEPMATKDIDQTILAGHVVYENPNFEFLNEAMIIRHQQGGKSYTTPALYTQIARQYGKLRPYFRYEWMNSPDNDPVRPDISLRHGPILGVKYDLGDYANLKLQYDNLRIRGMGASNQLTAQVGFTF